MDREVLNLISYDERTQKTITSVAGSIQDTYLALETTTEQLEQEGIFWVEDEHIDKHTLVRKFATAEEGHMASLIVVGGTVCSNTRNPNHQ